MDRKTVTKDEDDGAEVPLMVKVVPSQEHDDIPNDGKTTGNEFLSSLNHVVAVLVVMVLLVP